MSTILQMAITDDIARCTKGSDLNELTIKYKEAFTRESDKLFFEHLVSDRRKQLNA